MTLIRKLALALCWAFLFISYSNAQQVYTAVDPVSTTPNVVDNNAWNNAVYQNQLTCWAYGDPGYCGPNPIVRPGGNINFSYGTVDLHQIQSIASILPNSGTGLQVNGFNFGFTAKNGNGWDNGRQDYLSAYVKFYGANGVQGPEYDYTSYTNQTYNWTTFSFSETFTTPYRAPNLSSVRYGLIGRDNNFWAGPYGPEVYGVNFSLKYSVDPCSTNTFYSPTCAGYFDALAKLAPQPTAVTAVDYSLPPPPPPPDAPPPPLGSPPPQNGPPPPPGSPPPPPGSGPAPSSGPAPVAATAAPAGQQDKTVSGPGLGFALNLIAKNSEREKAIAQQAVTTSIAEAQAAGDKAQAIATSTANAAVVTSSTSAENSFSGNGIQVSSSNTRLNTMASVAVQAQGIPQLQGAQSFQSQQSSVQTSSFQLQAPATIESLQSTQNYGVFEIQVQRQQEVDVPQQAMNFISDRNNPLREIIQPTPQQQPQQEQQTTTVNRNVQANEAAAGVVLEKMAVVPTGYASYTNLALRDATFYESKPIYANQRVVDNVRVLRGLGSDAKHQELVNLQYK